MKRGLNWLGQGWALLSLVAALLSCSGFYMPYWIKGRLPGEVDAFFGSYRRCNYPKLTPQNTIVIVEHCARYSRWWDIPSGWWKASTLLVGLASALSIIVAVVSLCASCLPDVLTPATTKFSGFVQLIAGLMIGGGCAVYPMGWDVREVKDACGFSSHYKLGSCQVWWSAVLLGSAMLVLFLCFLLTHCRPLVIV